MSVMAMSVMVSAPSWFIWYKEILLIVYLNLLQTLIFNSFILSPEFIGHHILLSLFFLGQTYAYALQTFSCS